MRFTKINGRDVAVKKINSAVSKSQQHRNGEGFLSSKNMAESKRHGINILKKQVDEKTKIKTFQNEHGGVRAYVPYP